MPPGLAEREAYAEVELVPAGSVAIATWAKGLTRIDATGNGLGLVTCLWLPGGSSSTGRAIAYQAIGQDFETLLPLHHLFSDSSSDFTVAGLGSSPAREGDALAFISCTSRSDQSRSGKPFPFTLLSGRATILPLATPHI